MINLKSFEQFLAESVINEEGTKVEQATETPKTEESKPEATEVAPEKEEPKKTATDLLKECYETIKEEAAQWESDAHDEHTIESYMCEVASLIGNYSANTLKSLKEDYALEAYESACNSMKEAFCKKVDEAKEANMAPSNISKEEEEGPKAS